MIKLKYFQENYNEYSMLLEMLNNYLYLHFVGNPYDQIEFYNPIIVTITK
jgi:hypothetical protein